MRVSSLVAGGGCVVDGTDVDWTDVDGTDVDGTDAGPVGDVVGEDGDGVVPAVGEGPGETAADVLVPPTAASARSRISEAVSAAGRSSVTWSPTIPTPCHATARATAAAVSQATANAAARDTPPSSGTAPYGTDKVRLSVG